MKLTIRDLPLHGKRVLMRVDFNVPFNDDGSISDDSRIRAALPSIRYAIDHGGSLVLMSHLGRPDGKPIPKYSLRPCAVRLAELLDKPVAFDKEPGSIVLLENLRFHPGEEHPEKEPGFVDALAHLGDVYVNDAFGAAHRSHASITLLAERFPGKAAMGLLMEKELNVLSSLLNAPKRPFYAIMGGAKISTKLGVVNHLLKHVDLLFIGGGMAPSFFAAQNVKVGTSPIECFTLPPMGKIRLPTDLVIADVFAKDAHRQTVLTKNGIPDGWQSMDIGPRTIAEWSETLKSAGTIFWNGPLGVFEFPAFSAGTRAIAEALAQLKANVIIGGGDSIAAIEQMGFQNCFSHLSTGGGASLEFLEFGHLPGIDVLTEKI